MQIKKYSKHRLENYSKLFIELGLVLALLIVYQAFRAKSYNKPIKNYSSGFLIIEDNDEQVVDIKTVEVKTETSRPVIPDKIITVEDNLEVEESIIESSETDENEAITIENVEREIVEVEEIEEVLEDVPFVVIEEAPLFPGCKGSNSERKKCFSQKVRSFVMERFNIELATDLGLEPHTKHRISVIFRIDKKGNIVDVQARAPHKRLQEEAIRIVKLLPKMTPGKQRGKSVGVKYSLPITFKVES